METKVTQQSTFLEFFPLTLFAAVSTLSSLAYAWSYFGEKVKDAIGLTAIILFILFSITFLVKWIKYPQLVKKDFNDPIAVNLFAVFFTSLMLVSALIRTYSIQAALIVWIIGSITTFIFVYSLVTRWVSQQQNVLNALPGWTIPVLGILDIPLTGWSYPSPAVHEVSIFCFSVGLLLGFIVFILVIQRLIFQEGLAKTLEPTLLLLAGPFALMYANYQQMTGKQDLVAEFFFYSSIFLLLVLGRKLIMSLLHVQFTVTWWATSFPLAAVTAASFRYALHSTLPGAHIVLFFLLAVSSLVFLILTFQTLHYIIVHFLIKGSAKPTKRLSLADYKAAVLPAKHVFQKIDRQPVQ